MTGVQTCALPICNENLNKSHEAQAKQPKPSTTLQLSQSNLLEARQAVQQVHLAEPLERYLVDLVQATRHAGRYDEQLGRYIRMGASPRACLALDRCSRALAWLKGRAEVLPEDIQQLAPDVLRHRVLLSYEADAEGVRVDTVIQRLLRLVALA